MFYGSDFVTVTKDDSDWQHLKPAILGAIMEHYMSGAPLLADGSAASDEAADEEDEFFNEADAETVETIKDLIETRVRPAVASDGGDITFRGFKDGIVYLNMKGSCAGCPSSTATLAARHPEPAEAFRARRGRSPADVIWRVVVGWAKASSPCPPCISTTAWWARRERTFARLTFLS